MPFCHHQLQKNVHQTPCTAIFWVRVFSCTMVYRLSTITCTCMTSSVCMLSIPVYSSSSIVIVCMLSVPSVSVVILWITVKSWLYMTDIWGKEHRNWLLIVYYIVRWLLRCCLSAFLWCAVRISFFFILYCMLSIHVYQLFLSLYFGWYWRLAKQSLV